MTTTSKAPAYPNNGTTDFNAVLANDAAGKTGEALFDGAVTRPEGAEEAEAAARATTRAPRVGDTVEVEHTGGGWYAVTASWLPEPYKIRGEEEADAKRDDLIALIPAV